MQRLGQGRPAAAEPRLATCRPHGCLLRARQCQRGCECFRPPGAAQGNSGMCRQPQPTGGNTPHGLPSSAIALRHSPVISKQQASAPLQRLPLPVSLRVPRPVPAAPSAASS